ncbi:organic cation transporter protein-like [Glandiceps talaboti]
MLQFDDVLKHFLGEFGTYQKRIFILLGLVTFPTIYHAIVPVFFFAGTDFWCEVPNIDQISKQVCLGNFTTASCAELVKNITIPRETKDLGCGPISTFSQCQRYNVSLSDAILYSVEKDMSYIYNSTKLTCDYGWEYDTSQYTSTVSHEFDLVCGRSYLTALANSCYMFGVMVGSILYGIVLDKFGRIRGFVAAIVLVTVVGTIEAFSPSYEVFAFCRLVMALNMYGAYLASFVLITEMVGPSKRTLCGMVSMVFFGIGYMLLALYAYLLRTWWILQLVLTVPTILFVSFWWLVPESPRWLLSVGKNAQALEIIKTFAKVNKVSLPDDVFDESWKPSIADVTKDNKEMNVGGRFLIFELFRLPNMRKKTLILMYIWIVNTLVYFGLSFNTSNLGGNDFVNCFLAGAVEVPAYLLGIVMMDNRRLGRRWSMFYTMVIGGIACITASFVPQCGTYVWLGITITMISKLSVTCSFGMIYVYTAELFPTPVRSVGIGVCSMFARVGGIVAPQLLLMATIWEKLPAIVYGVAAIIAGILVYPLPETRGKKLPETMEEGERFGKKPNKRQDIGCTLTMSKQTVEADGSDVPMEYIQMT